MLRMTHTHSKTGDITTSAGKLLLMAADERAISAKRMSEALMGVGAHGVRNKYGCHPRECGEPVFRGPRA
jgi:hypothetical protein